MLYVVISNDADTKVNQSNQSMRIKTTDQWRDMNKKNSIMVKKKKKIGTVFLNLKARVRLTEDC